jgi:transposase-like protein
MNTNLIISLYSQLKSIRNISKITGLSRNKISKILKEAGILIPNRIRNFTFEEELHMVALFVEEKKSMKEIAKQFNVDYRCIKERLLKHGVILDTPIPNQYNEVYDEWAELYVNGWTYQAIAELYGAARETVRERLQRMGIPSRESSKRFTPETYQTWGELYKNGATLAEISLHYGVTESTVAKHLEALGIERRKGFQFQEHVYDSWINLYYGGYTTQEIADRYGVSKYPVIFHLKRKGVQLRQSWQFNLSKPHLLYKDPSEETKQLVIGSALGDGTFFDQKVGAYLRMKHKAGQREYLEYKMGILGEFVSDAGLVETETKFGDQPFQQVYACSVPNMFIKQIRVLSYLPEGRSIRDLISMIGPLALSIAWCDDGYYTRDQSGILNTCGFSWKDNQELAQYLQQTFGIECYVIKRYDKKYNQYYPAIYLTVKGMRSLKETIRDYVPPSMQYKLGE